MVALFLMPMAAMLFLYTRIGIELWIRKRVGDSSVLNTMNHREVNKISRYCMYCTCTQTSFIVFIVIDIGKNERGKMSQERTCHPSEPGPSLGSFSLHSGVLG